MCIRDRHNTVIDTVIQDNYRHNENADTAYLRKNANKHNGYRRRSTLLLWEKLNITTLLQFKVLLFTLMHIFYLPLLIHIRIFNCSESPSHELFWTESRSYESCSLRFILLLMNSEISSAFFRLGLLLVPTIFKYLCF